MGGKRRNVISEDFWTAEGAFASAIGSEGQTRHWRPFMRFLNVEALGYARFIRSYKGHPIVFEIVSRDRCLDVDATCGREGISEVAIAGADIPISGSCIENLNRIISRNSK